VCLRLVQRDDAGAGGRRGALRRRRRVRLRRLRLPAELRLRRVTDAQLDSPSFLAVVKARARLAFAPIAGETGAELDAAPPFEVDRIAHGRLARAWLEEREARYGATIPYRPGAPPR
jgi:hypothetical protein